MRSFADETDNILDLYRYSIGVSRVPMALFEWSCLAGIAACLEDRVWVEKLAKPVNPALWVALIAESGVGKDVAINELLEYMIGTDVNLFYGEVTAQALVKRMSGKPKAGHQSKAKVFLVNPEAAVCIGFGSRAKDFITHMTGSFELPRGVVYSKDALSSGDFKVYDTCINWLWGSTMRWAIDAIPPDAIQGGFLGRILPIIIPGYEHSKVVATRPDDLKEVRAKLMERFQQLREMEGQFKVSRQARELHHKWDQERVPPKDERLIPTYIRMDTNVWKLSMVFSAADSDDMVILHRHMKLAIEACARREKHAEIMLNASSVTERTRDGIVVVAGLKRGKWMKHSVLMQFCSGRGLNKRAMMEQLDILNTQGRLASRMMPSENRNGKAVRCYSLKTKWGDPDEPSDVARRLMNRLRAKRREREAKAQAKRDLVRQRLKRSASRSRPSDDD